MARKNKGPKNCLLVILILFLCVPGGCFGFDTPRNHPFQRVGDPGLPFLTFYTSGLATTPQLAFWQAVEKGRILEKCNIQIKLWKNLNELQTALLAGKGDLWLGHTDKFVEAGLRGAPVQLLLTTGWRKFYLVSSNPRTLRFRDFIGKALACTPPGSPAVPVLRGLGNNEFAKISFAPCAPNDLMLQLARGDLGAALLPEPLVTKALLANPRLLVGENVETVYGQYSGYLKGMPIAGIAVNSRTASNYPELIAWLAKETLTQAKILAKAPMQGAEHLPQEFQSLISKDVLQGSLQREQLRAAYSSSVRPEIEAYMNLILSAAGHKNKPLPDSLFWNKSHP